MWWVLDTRCKSNKEFFFENFKIYSGLALLGFFPVVYAGLHAWTTFGNSGPGSSDPPFEILNQDPTKSSGSGYATLTKTNLVFRKNRDTRFRPRIKIL